MNGIAHEFACQRRRQQREYMFYDRRRQQLLQQWRLMLLERRRIAHEFACARRHLLHLMLHKWRIWIHLFLMESVWQIWRREAGVRLRAMAALRRWRDARMVQARRRRPARVLIRRSIEEWWTYMLIHRAARGGGTYPLRTSLEAMLGRAIGDLAHQSWWQ